MSRWNCGVCGRMISLISTRHGDRVPRFRKHMIGMQPGEFCAGSGLTLCESRTHVDRSLASMTQERDPREPRCDPDRPDTEE